MASEQDVVFNFFAGIFLGEFTAEDGVGEAGLVPDTGGEGDVGIVKVSRAPGEGPRIESYEEDCITGGLGAVKELRIGNYQNGLNGCGEGSS